MLTPALRLKASRLAMQCRNIKHGLSGSRPRYQGDDVFFSFSFSDRTLVLEFKKLFEEHALTAYADSGVALREGEEWYWYLGDRIDNAMRVVAVWSKSASRSPAVQQEIARAYRQNKLMWLPVDLTEVPNNMESIEADLAISAGGAAPEVMVVQEHPAALIDQSDDCVRCLRESGQLPFLAYGLLVRTRVIIDEARRSRRRGKFASAEMLFGRAAKDLEEIRYIAESAELMPLIVDCHIEDARLELARIEPIQHSHPLEGKGSQASDDKSRHSIPEAESRSRDATGMHLNQAESVINKIGYHRREAELAYLRENLKRLFR
jgi:hypothetical protein